MSKLFDGLMLSHERQLLGCDYPFYCAYENPPSAAFSMVSKECRDHGEDHAIGKPNQDSAFRR